MLYGTLVDLVPFGERFRSRDHDWLNNESRFWGSMGEYGFISRAAVEREYEEFYHSEHPRTGVWFGILTKDGTPIGGIGINWLSEHHRVADLGAVIGELQYWGGGYGTDALLLVVDYAFDRLDMRKVWLGTMSLNARVMRQMEKVGFALEARLREGALADGRWYDELTYGRLRDGWPGYAAMVAALGIVAR
ncbi:MAG: GNAT family N-acetyltransferase [Anaerolineae bacterium]|nr:GNAT family N-acetyltransferase [Anaerolineae bacterium]